MHFSVPSVPCWNHLTATLIPATRACPGKIHIYAFCCSPQLFQSSFCVCTGDCCYCHLLSPLKPVHSGTMYFFNRSVVWLCKLVLNNFVPPLWSHEECRNHCACFSSLFLSLFYLFSLLWTDLHNWNFQVLCIKLPLKTTPMPLTGFVARRQILQPTLGKPSTSPPWQLQQRSEIAETTEWAPLLWRRAELDFFCLRAAFSA